MPRLTCSRVFSTPAPRVLSQRTASPVEFRARRPPTCCTAGSPLYAGGLSASRASDAQRTSSPPARTPRALYTCVSPCLPLRPAVPRTCSHPRVRVQGPGRASTYTAMLSRVVPGTLDHSAYWRVCLSVSPRRWPSPWTRPPSCTPSRPYVRPQRQRSSSPLPDVKQSILCTSRWAVLRCRLRARLRAIRNENICDRAPWENVGRCITQPIIAAVTHLLEHDERSSSGMRTGDKRSIDYVKGVRSKMESEKVGGSGNISSRAL